MSSPKKRFCLIVGGALVLLQAAMHPAHAVETHRLVIPIPVAQHLLGCRAAFIDTIREELLVHNLWATEVIVSPLDCNTTFLLPDGRTVAVVSTEMTYSRWSTGLPAPSVKPGPGFT
ncbi:MAG TPA: hypothetical protein VK997_04675, partial [Deferrisomatales bacterium]|nr:hypothetical protein [Deferrisomatales bacterium]